MPALEEFCLGSCGRRLVKPVQPDTILRPTRVHKATLPSRLLHSPLSRGRTRQDKTGQADHAHDLIRPQRCQRSIHCEICPRPQLMGTEQLGTTRSNINTQMTAQSFRTGALLRSIDHLGAWVWILEYLTRGTHQCEADRGLTKSTGEALDLIQAC